MARVTVEDCLEFVENRFDLVLVAARRAHELNAGVARSTLNVGKDKPTVVALREIAEGLIDKSILDKKDYLSDEALAEAADDERQAAEIKAELSQTILEEGGDIQIKKDDLAD